MKTIKICTLLLATLMLFTVLPCSAAGKVAFTGTESFCFTCVCADCNPGTWEKGNTKVRNWESVYFYTASDPRAAGYWRVEVNWDLDDSFSGPAWGSFYSCDASGNRIPDGWEGKWNGQIFGFFPSYNWIAKYLAEGIGEYKGLKMDSTSAYGYSLTGTIVGVIQNVNKEWRLGDSQK